MLQCDKGPRFFMHITSPGFDILAKGMRGIIAGSAINYNYTSSSPLSLSVPAVIQRFNNLWGQAIVYIYACINVLNYLPL